MLHTMQRAALARQQEQANKASAAAGLAVEHPAASSAPATKCSFCANEISGVKKSCACGLASYCGKTCQIAHFPQHKGICKARRQK